MKRVIGTVYGDLELLGDVTVSREGEENKLSVHLLFTECVEELIACDAEGTYNDIIKQGGIVDKEELFKHDGEAMFQVSAFDLLKLDIRDVE